MVNTQKKNIQKIYKDKKLQKIVITPKEEPKQEAQPTTQQQIPQLTQQPPQQKVEIRNIVGKVKKITINVINKTRTGIKGMIDKITKKPQPQQVPQEQVQQTQPTQEQKVEEKPKEEKLKKKQVKKKKTKKKRKK